MQKSTKLICDEFFTDCASINFKPNSRNVNLASHMSSILGMWLVLVSCVWILTRWLLSSTGSHLKILRVCSSFSASPTITIALSSRLHV